MAKIHECLADCERAEGHEGPCTSNGGYIRCRYGGDNHRGNCKDSRGKVIVAERVDLTNEGGA
jgi:hypothetical protein